MKRRLLLCLILSGFAGLAYELLWVRLLATSFGATTESLSTVLAIFFGGLGLGSWFAARILDRLQRPILAYACIEAVIGLYALLLYPVLLHLGDWFAYIDAGPNFAGACLRFATAAPLLLPPTILMGMTLPIICRALIGKDGEIESWLSLTYGFNTLGAFLGAYLVTYHLLWQFGVFYTLVIAAVTNFTAAAISWAISGSSRIPAIVPPHKVAAAHTDRPYSGKLALLITFISGFSFICAEVVWVRIFATALRGTTYGVGSVLISVLAGIALGGVLSSRIRRKDRDLALVYMALQLVLIVSIVLMFRAIAPITGVLDLFARAKLPVDPIFPQLLVVFLAMLIPSTAAGAAFPMLVAVVAQHAANAGKTLGRIYAANTFGSILGSLTAGFVLFPNYGTEFSAWLGLVVICAGGALSWFLLEDKAARVPGIALVGACVAAIYLFDGYDPVSLQMSRVAAAGRSPLQVAYFSEGKTSSVLVTRQAEGMGLFLNGLGQGGRRFLSPHYDADALLTALVPLSHVKQPRNALVVGLGAGATVDLLSRCEVSVKVVEIEEKVVRSVDLIFAGDNPLSREGVTLVIDDARHHLKVQSIRKTGQYDLITSMPSHPWVAPSLFTREFFALARENLSDRGVFSTWFAVNQNMDAPDIQSLVTAFTSVFTNYALYHLPEANAMFLVGGKTQLYVSPDYLTQLTQHEAFSGNRVARDWTFLPSRIIGSGNGSVPEKDSPYINTDDSLFIELHAPRRKRQLSGTRFQALCATPHLLPEMLDSDSPKEHLFEILETMLGTPQGIIPERGQVIQVALAERSISGTADLWTQIELAYWGGRVAAARGEFARSVELLNQVPSTHPLKGRAAKFAALVGPQATRDLAQLKQLPYSSDVALEIAAIDLSAVPEMPTAEPSTSLLAIFDRVRQGSSNAADQDRFRDLVPDLIQSRRLGSLRIGAFVSESFSLLRIHNMLVTRQGKLLTEQHTVYLANANQALRTERYADAIAWYEAARQVGSVEIDVFQRMYHCYLQLGLSDKAASLLELAELRGQSEQWRTLLKKEKQPSAK